MTFLNKFHEEAVLRRMRKIADALQQSQMSSKEFADCMRCNLELANKMSSQTD